MFGALIDMFLMMVVIFFLTIVDDYTRATWLYLMKSKKLYISFITQFYAYVETQFHTKIQIIRTAKELCEGESKVFYLL